MEKTMRTGLDLFVAFFSFLVFFFACCFHISAFVVQIVVDVLAQYTKGSNIQKQNKKFSPFLYDKGLSAISKRI